MKVYWIYDLGDPPTTYTNWRDSVRTGISPWISFYDHHFIVHAGAMITVYFHWSHVVESNNRPYGYESYALPTELTCEKIPGRRRDVWHPGWSCLVSTCVVVDTGGGYTGLEPVTTCFICNLVCCTNLHLDSSNVLYPSELISAYNVWWIICRCITFFTAVSITHLLTSNGGN